MQVLRDCTDHHTVVDSQWDCIVGVRLADRHQTCWGSSLNHVTSSTHIHFVLLLHYRATKIECKILLKSRIATVYIILSKQSYCKIQCRWFLSQVTCVAVVVALYSGVPSFVTPPQFEQRYHLSWQGPIYCVLYCGAVWWITIKLWIWLQDQVYVENQMQGLFPAGKAKYKRI